MRIVLETFRAGWNWTIAGVPTAMLVGGALIILGAVTILWRHRESRRPSPPAALPAEG